MEILFKLWTRFSGVKCLTNQKNFADLDVYTIKDIYVLYLKTI